MEGVRVSVLFCNLGVVCGGFGDVRYVCVVFWVLVMRCLYSVSMRQPKVRRDHSVRVFGGEFSMGK
jgi:hypothetical protein